MRDTLIAAVLMVALSACSVATPSPIPSATPSSSSMSSPPPTVTPSETSPGASATTAVPTEGGWSGLPATPSPTPAGPTATAGEPTESPFLPLRTDFQFEPGPNDVSVTLSPSSLAGAELGKVYAFTIDHCGLMSPFDFDGSFWVATGGIDRAGGPVDSDDEIGELINVGSGRIVLTDQDTLQYETGDLESVIEMQRHDGDKAFFLCE